MKRSERAAQYIELRDQGMTYAEIAKICGVSYQAVAMCIGKWSPGHFKPLTKEAVVYPNLRLWMNENEITRNEFIRRMNLAISGGNSERFSSYFKGKCDPPKKTIDKMLQVTGMTYEELFYREDLDE